MLQRCAWLLLSICLPVVATEIPSVNWAALRPEIYRHYTDVLSIDTSNPPGNETRAVDYLRSVLDTEGIHYETFALTPERGNLVVRIKGNGSKQPLLFMGHTDVVTTQRDKWASDPFKPLRKDGFVYARGSNDDKDSVTAGLMLILLLHRNQVKLDRDFIFLAEAGEEGTSTYGVDFMVKQHWDAIDAEYALAEGGGGLARQGKLIAVTVSTTEKSPRPTLLRAAGTAGHGSIPRLDNPIAHVAAAVAKVAAHQPPMRLNDTTRAYFEKLATISDPEHADRYNHIADPARTEEVQAYLARWEPQLYSMLRTSVVPTIINAGFRTNVIPSTAEATLDVRALPDENMDNLYGYLRSVIADPEVEVVSAQRDMRPTSPPSPLDSEMFKTLEAVQKRLYPSAITLPTMLTGATDNAQLRSKGVKAYGIGPWTDEEDGGIGAAHTENERMREEYLYQFIEYLWTVVTQMAAAQ
ncbi:MAG TPA: M20/M25/M40 family metallo-hydrolase [Bryobacteraceae bacterium]|jgi:acetylornithine deacetylase/succinyl-diaminopimelate desuccinylase-like protein|nr:M20/M25/M40 family metallo-hydrolase [Bryobacteraceae bacterium]